MKNLLHYPYKYEESYVCIHDGVFFIPLHTKVLPPVELPKWNTPIHVEYCSGNGEWICDKAKGAPHITWIAIEKRFDRVQKIHKRMKREGLENLFIVFGEAEVVTEHYFQNKWIDEVFINFPDPWPKRKHAKYRLIKNEFLDQMERVVKGNVTFVTDDHDYKEEVRSTFLSHTSYESTYFDTNLEGYGSSYFEQLWLSKGKTIYYQKYAIRNHSA